MVDKNPHVVAFGKRVRELRKEKGISQENLALMSGIDRSYMGKIERGEFNITLIKIFLISDALEVHVTDLFTDI